MMGREREQSPGYIFLDCSPFWEPVVREGSFPNGDSPPKGEIPQGVIAT